jgi:hypothetical protein
MYEYTLKRQKEIKQEFLEGFGRHCYVPLFKVVIMYMLESNKKLFLIIYELIE